MIYVIIGGLWISCILESLIHLLNFRFWNRADNITKTIDILGISQNSWAKTTHYQKKQYYFDEVSRLSITVAITVLIIGQGFPWLETFALRLSDEENSSFF